MHLISLVQFPYFIGLNNANLCYNYGNSFFKQGCVNACKKYLLVQYNENGIFTFTRNFQRKYGLM